METIREILTGEGLVDVATHLASGNVWFSAGADPAETSETRIEAALERALGYPVDTFVRTLAELETVVTGVPFSDDEVAEAHGLMINFLKRAPDAATVGQIEAASTDTDRFVMGDRVLYWLRRTSESDPRLSRIVEQAVAEPLTGRTIRTAARMAKG
jgi:uncharacterized protein (DUF1697 family)